MALNPGMMGGVLAAEVLPNFTTETPLGRSRHILTSMERFPIAEGIKRLPDLSDWNELEEGAKLNRFREVLEGEWWQIAARYADDRCDPTADSLNTKNKYHNFILPWVGEYYQRFGQEKFDQAMKAGSIDTMVREMREKELLKVGLDLESESISVASSTGSNQSLWQYDQGLQTLEKLREIAKGGSWGEVRAGVEQMIEEQDQKIKLELGLDHDDVLVRMQSGSDLPLLNGLFGSRASQITNETGTASWAAASLRETSAKGVFGEGRKVDGSGKMPKLVGFEEIDDATELELRDAAGEYLDPDVIKMQVDVWIMKKREMDPNCCLTIGVTAGGKTGIGWGVGGLRLEDAIQLRNKYAQRDQSGRIIDENRILIAVDNAQGRLDRYEVMELKRKKVMIDFTGSKILEGTPYSAARYIPKEYVDLAREQVKDNPKLLEGLSRYVTKGDLKTLLGEELVATSSLKDIPDIFSLLKWQGPVKTMEEMTRLVPITMDKFWVRDLMDNMRRKLEHVGYQQKEGKWVERQVGGHSYHIEIVQDQLTWNRFDPRFEMLMPFRVIVDGKPLKERELRAIHKAMSEVSDPDFGSRTGRMVNIGQYVAGANVLRVAPGMMALLGMASAKVRINYQEQLGEIIKSKLEEVIEVRVRKMRSLPSWSEMVRRDWEETQTKNAFNLMEKIKEEGDLQRKVSAIVEMYGKTFRMGQGILPVALISGKNVAALDLLYRSWMISGRGGNPRTVEDQRIVEEMGGMMQENRGGELDAKGEDLPVAFVDHPYILIGKDGELIPPSDSVYAVLIKSLQQYPRTHLYLYGAGSELIHQLEEAGIDSARYTKMSKPASPTSFENQHPDWYRKVLASSDEEPFILTQDEAMMINERHKGGHTDLMLYQFLRHNPGRMIAISRGNRGSQAGREETLPWSVSDELDFLGIHMLTGLTESEIEEWIKLHELPVVPNYIDWLKEAQNSCGLDIRFKMVKPAWLIEKRKKDKLK